jgi:hypothetical protein
VIEECCEHCFGDPPRQIALPPTPPQDRLDLRDFECHFQNRLTVGDAKETWESR